MQLFGDQFYSLAADFPLNEHNEGEAGSCFQCTEDWGLMETLVGQTLGSNGRMSANLLLSVCQSHTHKNLCVCVCVCVRTCI